MGSIVFHTQSNKRKNRVNSEKLFEFENFAVPDSMNKTLSGAFRDNIRIFLQNFAEIEEYTVNEMPVWSTSLFSENEGVFPLYTMEETVRNSFDHLCHHCELSGWGHHFICKRKYHLIIPAKENWNEPLDEDFAEIESHSLYGLIHCNGYGHLIHVNGLKNKSRFFAADDSMEFWDRLCTVLRTRNISALHVSRKEAVELSLIHGVAYGEPWFEKWGYKFGDGIPGITEQFNSAILFLSSLRLDTIISDFKNKSHTRRIREMIEMYRKLSDKPLITISDLLNFMLAFESRISTGISNACSFDSGTWETPMRLETFVDQMTKDCRWSARRLEDVLFVIIDQLKKHKANNLERERGISRQELRDEARRSIGDTGLIDFVLKSIKCFAVDNLIVRRAINPFSKLAEFTIHETPPGTCSGLGLDLSRDVRFLYDHVLAGYYETRVVLNSNQFEKEWPLKGETTNQMKLTCKVLPTFDEFETHFTRPLSPGEVVVVEPWITIGDLKMVAQWALRDTYCVMDEFVVSQIGGLRKIDDEKVLSSTVEDGAQVWVRGYGMDCATPPIYEDGAWPESEGLSFATFCSIIEQI
ncbi:PHD finger protein [Sesamum alatum]|uniref:PHD finger protein n=1 Tax=Sesamum alatum TaxID=300844 RepID=A0AAE2CIF8_9LAMI|nr:PHD finger protein [Sesamum alatum]